MEIGEIIEFVRKQKGLTIKDVCGDTVSRSVYHRFVTNRASTNISNVVYMLHKINLSFDDLKIFDYPSGISSLQQLMLEMRNAFMKQDVEELLRIKEFCQSPEHAEKQHYQHVRDLCDYSIARLTGKELDTSETSLYCYLINVQTWTRYELIMFNNSMHTFTPEFLELILDKALMGMNQYRESREGRSECFRLLANAIVLFIQNDRLKTAWKYLDRLNNFSLDEELFFEKSLSLVINGLWELIRGNQEGKEKLKRALRICSDLDAANYYQMNKDLIDFVADKYGLVLNLEG